jgi:hypothetical protein
MVVSEARSRKSKWSTLGGNPSSKLRGSQEQAVVEQVVGVK